MTNTPNDQPNQQAAQTAPAARATHPAWYAAVALALAGNVALLMYSHNMARTLADLRESTQAQIGRLNQQMAQSGAESERRVGDVVREARESVVAAQERALNESRRSNASLTAKLAQARVAQQRAQQQVAGQLDELKQASSKAESKLNEIGGDVETAKSQLEGHSSDLKRVTGDMGVMSGLIATNSKELSALRDLGERNYIEFDLKKKREPQKVGGIQLAVVKADPKRNRFTLNVLADDKRVEKRDRTINEPVQLYVSGNRQPLEIVVNEVKKDEVVGYLAVPKVTVPRR